ncbi:Guanine nucleotide exchange factor lte1 [Massospora cicadina]|nr:Guanine nucleotide exchange factor lte1 [Massospora cicadina]
MTESFVSSTYDSPVTPVDSNTEHCQTTESLHAILQDLEATSALADRCKNGTGQDARYLQSSPKRPSFNFDNIAQPANYETRGVQAGSHNDPEGSVEPDLPLVLSTVEQLIEALTSRVGKDLLIDFFITYRLFLSPLELCQLLEKRFIWALDGQSAQQQIARVRTFIVVRHWVSSYYPQDFLASPPTLSALDKFLSRAAAHPAVLASESDQRIVFQMRRCLRDQEEIYGKAPLESGVNRPPSYPNSGPFGNREERGQPHQAHGPYDKHPKKGVRGFFDNLQHRARELALKAKDHNPKPKTAEPMHHTIQITHNLSLTDLVAKRSFHEIRGHALHQHLFQRFAGVFILEYSPELIARQFCIIEKRCLGDVGWQELVAWGHQPVDTSSSIAAVVARFNMTCEWVASVVVTCHRIEDRVGVIERLIQVAHFSLLHRNFATTLQIVLGLQSGTVARLKHTWGRVSAADMQLFGSLSPYAVPLRNWSSIRRVMEGVVDRVPSGLPASQSSSLGLGVKRGLLNDPSFNAYDHCGAIPFLGLYLSDLVYNAELESKQIQRMAGIVRRVWLFQDLASAGYTFAPHPKLYPDCLFLPTLPNEKVLQLTLACEP